MRVMRVKLGPESKLYKYRIMEIWLNNKTTMKKEKFRDLCLYSV